MVVVMDNYTRVLLTVIACLLTLIAIPLWNYSGNIDSQAQAAVSGRPGIPDSGQQMQELIDLTRETKAILLEIGQTLKSGTIKVEIDNESDPLPAKKNDNRKSGAK
ncbi:MAG: hypothetical protein JXM68_09925 [Sedimentisphaerales bacterium]|nr:hypothetical protein [Sedimentisphaerales bacterium]